MNRYEIQARIFPSFINSISFLIFWFFYLERILPDSFKNIFSLKVIGNVTVAVIILYAFSMASRYLGKRFIQDRYFDSELKFPTVTYLLYSDNTFTLNHKDEIRKKIQADFSISLPNKTSEAKDEDQARKEINQAIGQIRNKLKDGRLILQHNIEYGFMRNFFGGLYVSIPVLIFDTAFFYINRNNTALSISLFLLVLFLALFFLKKSILKYHANNYAQVLFNEYLASGSV